MESQKITNILENTDEYDLKYATKKWYIINDGSMEMIRLLNLIQRL